MTKASVLGVVTLGCAAILASFPLRAATVTFTDFIGTPLTVSSDDPSRSSSGCSTYGPNAYLCSAILPTPFDVSTSTYASVVSYTYDLQFGGTWPTTVIFISDPTGTTLTATADVVWSNTVTAAGWGYYFTAYNQGSSCSSVSAFGPCVPANGQIQQLGTVTWSDGIVDTVQFQVSSVPEPQTLFLVATAFLGLIFPRIRNRKS